MTPPRPAATAPALDPHLVRGLQELFGLPVRALRTDAELDGDLQLDSLATAELQVWLEDAVGVRLAASADASPPRTLGALQARLEVALVRRTDRSFDRYTVTAPEDLPS